MKINVNYTPHPLGLASARIATGTGARCCSGNGNVGFAAERADRAVMDTRAAIRTALLEDLPAERAEPPSRGIRRGPVRPQKRPPLNLIRHVGRTLRIGTEPVRNGRHCVRARELACGRFPRGDGFARVLSESEVSVECGVCSRRADFPAAGPDRGGSRGREVLCAVR